MTSDIIAVCIPTFLRPKGLATVLDAIEQIDDPGARVHVMVVDNDAQGSAATVVDAARAQMTVPVHYEIEPRRGIAFGRNHAVRMAREVGATHIAFIDDDEVPSAGWLRELLRVQHATGADVVMGPVLPRFEVPPPAWVLRGGFFDRGRRATGTPMHYATTGNALVTIHTFGEGDQPFAEWTGLLGGEDTHFFMRAVLAGRRIVWCDEADVSELIASSRVNAHWLMRRRYRYGNTLSLCLVDLQNTPWRRVRRVCGALLRMARGALRVVPGALLGRAMAVRGLCELWYGAGQLTGLAGRRYEEYSVIHGT